MTKRSEYSIRAKIAAGRWAATVFREKMGSPLVCLRFHEMSPNQQNAWIAAALAAHEFLVAESESESKKVKS